MDLQDLLSLSVYNPIYNYKLKSFLDDLERQLVDKLIDTSTYDEIKSKLDLPKTSLNCAKIVASYCECLRRGAQWKLGTPILLHSYTRLDKLCLELQSVNSPNIEEKFSELLVDCQGKAIRNEEAFWDSFHWLMEFVKHNCQELSKLENINDKFTTLSKIYYYKSTKENAILESIGFSKMSLFGSTEPFTDYNAAEIFIIKDVLTGVDCSEKLSSFYRSIFSNFKKVDFYKTVLELEEFRNSFLKNGITILDLASKLNCAGDNLYYYYASCYKRLYVEGVALFSVVTRDLLLDERVLTLRNTLLNRAVNGSNLEELRGFVYDELGELESYDYDLSDIKPVVSVILSMCEEMIIHEKTDR